VSPPRDVDSANGSVLWLDVSGPTELSLGQPLHCRIRVRNPGPQVLAGVKVEAPLPDGVRALFTEPLADNLGDRVAWRLGNLEAGGERTIKLELMPSMPGVVHLNPVATYAAAVGLRTHVVRPPFAVSISSVDSAPPGAPVALEIQVTNHQTVSIERVTLRVLLGFDMEYTQQQDARVEQALLRKQLPVGLDHPQGNVIETDLGSPLGPGEMRTLRLDARAVRSGRWATVVRAFGEGVPDTRAQGVVRVTQPALLLELRGARTGALHQEQTFQLQVTNPQPAAAEKVRLAQVIPDGLEFIDGSTGAVFNPTTHEVCWVLDRLEPGQRQVVTFRARTKLVGDWALSAMLTADGNAEARVHQALHVDSGPTLTLSVTCLDNTLELGGETDCQVCIDNQGPAPGTDLQLTLIVPDALLPSNPTGPTRGLIQEQRVVYETLAALPSQTGAVYRLRVRGFRPGDGQFRAILTSRGLNEPISQEVTCHVRGGSAVRAYPSP
jgi:hypothetical protein